MLEDALHIVIDVRHAREGCLTELTRECSAGFIDAAKTRQWDREKSVRTLA